MTITRIGHYLKGKVFRNDQAAQHAKNDALAKTARATVDDIYIEEDPRVSEWLRSLVPTANGGVAYVRDLFPSASWIHRYNRHWLLGDVIAGVTAGLVVVPQSMAYASLARLSPAYGLYTTFSGVCLYWIFGTSKDIVIGATAVGSLLIGRVVDNLQTERPGEYQATEVASAISLLCGLIVLGLGLLRLGWLIEFIPYPPINAFVASASITIISTQLPTCLGIEGVNTRDAPYKVYLQTLKRLPRVQADAAIGISSIILLSSIQKFCSIMEKRQPTRKRSWAMISALRLTLTMLLYTLVSWLVNRKTQNGFEKFRIVGTIEKGFSHTGIPKMDGELFGLIAKEVPAIVIILIVEHIAIVKNFGREHGYTVNPSQEILAQGIVNVLGPFIGGYACTGSFGASAVLAKAGVRTPLAGLFSAGVLILAMYALTAVFYYIPKAALAGLIIHATWNLITPPHKLFNFWQSSPPDLGIWIISVALAVFVDLETSIYVGIALSFALLLIRMARTSPQRTGQAQVSRITSRSATSNSATLHGTPSPLSPSVSPTRPVYLPLTTPAAHNPRLSIQPPHPGIFIYRFAETYNYLNQASHTAHLTSHIQAHTRRTVPDDGTPAHERIWSETPPPARTATKTKYDEEPLPLLRAVVLDFSTVNVIDATSVQGLQDLRGALEKWARPEVVEFHFAGVRNRWTRRALVNAGFGAPYAVESGRWSPVYSVGNIAEKAEITRRNRSMFKNIVAGEEELGLNAEEKTRLGPVYGVERPFLHVDLADAVEAALCGARRAEETCGVEFAEV